MFARERCGNMLHERVYQVTTPFRCVYSFMCHNLYLYTCVITIDDIILYVFMCVKKRNAFLPLTILVFREVHFFFCGV